MAHPTTKPQLISRMRQGHQEFYNVISRIPDERMHEIALYDTWTIKDFIAHIGWWQNTAAERVDAILRGENPDLPHGNPPLNAEIQEQYRNMPLDEVRIMESRSFSALEKQVEIASEDDIFELHPLIATYDLLLDWIADNSYAHYAEHLPDVRAWMQKIGLE